MLKGSPRNWNIMVTNMYYMVQLEVIKIFGGVLKISIKAEWKIHVVEN